MSGLRIVGWTAALLLSWNLGAASVAFAQLEFDWGGRLQSNVRFQYDDVEAGNFYERRAFNKGVARNEHILKLRGSATSDRFSGIMDIDFVWLNFGRDVSNFDDLSLRENVEPTRFEAHAAYIEALDFLFDGLDIRIGQQIVAWGVGDQFNPTNNLNADDVEDRLLYGVQQANLMGRLTYTYEDVFSLDAVLVPVFKPALLPASGAIALALVDRLPMLDPNFRHRLISENAYAASEEAFPGPDELRRPTRVADIIVDTPAPSFNNLQFGFRLATSLFEQDLSVSYYQGFIDFPVPVQNVTSFNPDAPTTVCNDPSIDPADPDLDAATRYESCVNPLDTTTTLSYPRVRVLGFNMAGEINPLGWISDVFNPIGYRIEVGVYLPEEKRIRLLQENISFGGFDVGREYDYNGLEPGLGQAPLVLEDTPYAKWVVGLDYTFNQHLYLNVQWVHGLAEETGAGDWINSGYTVRRSSARSGIPLATQADEVTLLQCVQSNRIAGTGVDPGVCARETLRPRIGDYLVTGLDFIFDSTRGLLRLFTIIDLTPMMEEAWNVAEGRRTQTDISPFSKEGFSMVLFPELNYNFGGGFELGAGALVFLGRDYTKFGDPAAGGSVIWTRGRFSF